MKYTVINPLIAKCNKLCVKAMKVIGITIKDLRSINESFLKELKSAIELKENRNEKLEMALKNFIHKNSGFWPSKTADFGKVSDRAYEFVTSLGKPDKSLISYFTAYVNNLPDMYEQFLELPDGIFLYLIKHQDVIVALKFNSFRNKLHYTGLTLDDLIYHFEEYLKKSNETTEFDGVTFIINLWMSTQNEVLEFDDKAEPLEEKQNSRHICEKIGYKAKEFAYRYIHITDTKWQKYRDAITAIRDSSDVNYKLPSWFVRAHWRKYNDKVVFVKAHFAYRKCKEVQETELIDLYV